MASRLIFYPQYFAYLMEEGYSLTTPNLMTYCPRKGLNHSPAALIRIRRPLLTWQILLKLIDPINSNQKRKVLGFEGSYCFQLTTPQLLTPQLPTFLLLTVLLRPSLLLTLLLLTL